MHNGITINIDADGTCFKHEFPIVGGDIGAAPVLRKLVAGGHKLILFTMRSDKEFRNPDGSITDCGLQDAVNWFKQNDIPLYGIQTNPTQSSWTSSPKSYAELMIDDSALGCPLKWDYVEVPVHPHDKVNRLVYGETMTVKTGRPYVDWVEVERMLIERGLIE
jgi:hypothetical protein